MYSQTALCLQLSGEHPSKSAKRLAQKRAESICGHKTQTRMASRECDIRDECINIRGISESLWNQLDHEQLPSFLEDDGDYVETWQNKTEFEREEQAREEVTLFLEEFPAQKEELKKCIRRLWEMADAIDNTHKRCTVASLAANSTSASSGILTVLGMTLAPFTAGGSLILTAAGLGLGTVAAAAGVSASIYESVSTSKETRKAQELMHACGRSLQMAMRPDEAEISSKGPTNNDAVGGNVKNLVCTVAAQVPCAYKNVKGIKTNVKALKYVQANTGLKPSKYLANRAAEAGRAFWGKVWGGKPVEKAFSGTTLAMTKGARLLGAATAGASVLLDAYNITQDAKHLSEGAKAEMAAEIRDEARKLEAELQELDKRYEELKNKLNKRNQETRNVRIGSCIPGPRPSSGHVHRLPSPRLKVYLKVPEPSEELKNKWE
ncbi:hypothetical protein lerEdw1_019652 [Lerista edwardsae]|nr:hypothetical protein lerEdw1_019652 [Lerista edwardsae]